MDKLNHTFRLGYIVGTNDEGIGDGFNRGGTPARSGGGASHNAGWGAQVGAAGMDKDFSLIEFDIENTLKIVDNLEFRFDLGILAPRIKDNDGDAKGKADTGFVLATALVYNF